ncbi:major facilitator superfamily transporter [Bimuria novae-zelandiae CBS 107.79]|uniref:Major facilitator superfamily transporter n=1 Tax=Bimuria novae-zelandiae CBS 107.79 TaxID=1447943 RepID=A0A6A5V5G5_9PLEO|nr:major facilitator superfamily transporter [Bimuria novae-zelandiae CBS 107.79]
MDEIESKKEAGVSTPTKDAPDSGHGEVFLSDTDILRHPQAVDDALDPLNWSSFQKHTILAIVMSLYFMFTYITTTTVPSFPELQEQYGLSAEEVNWTVAVPALGLALGPLFWSSFADIIGRRVIFISGTVVALAASIGAALAPTYNGYMAARFFQGFGVSPAATVGLAIINDIFFEHQRGQKMGLWVLAIDLGLLVGPLIGGFIGLVSHQWIQWLCVILFGAILAAEIAFLPETLYPRNYMLAQQEARKGAIPIDDEKATGVAGEVGTADSPRTKELAFVNVKTMPSIKHPRPWASLLRFLMMFKFFAIPIITMVFCYGWYWWILAVITMFPVAYAQYSPQIQGLLFLGMIIGTLISELFFSGALSDKIVLRDAKANNGIRTAESRLWLAYPAALLTSVGLIVWGISIDREYHWMVGQVATALFAAGVQMGNTVTTSYIVDCYSLQAMSIVTFYSVHLNLSAFISPFFIVPWVDASGFAWTFAGQGIIVFFFCVPVFALVHIFGARIRNRSGIPNWVDPEHDT